MNRIIASILIITLLMLSLIACENEQNDGSSEEIFDMTSNVENSFADSSEADSLAGESSDISNDGSSNESSEISSHESSEPEISEPETSEPETSEPETSEPETSEPESSDPNSGWNMPETELTSKSYSTIAGFKAAVGNVYGMVPDFSLIDFHQIQHTYYYTVATGELTTNMKYYGVWLNEGERYALIKVYSHIIADNQNREPWMNAFDNYYGFSYDKASIKTSPEEMELLVAGRQYQYEILKYTKEGVDIYMSYGGATAYGNKRMELTFTIGDYSFLIKSDAYQLLSNNTDEECYNLPTEEQYTSSEEYSDEIPCIRELGNFYNESSELIRILKEAVANAE